MQYWVRPFPSTAPKLALRYTMAIANCASVLGDGMGRTASPCLGICRLAAVVTDNDRDGVFNTVVPLHKSSEEATRSCQLELAEGRWSKMCILANRDALQVIFSSAR